MFIVFAYFWAKVCEAWLAKRRGRPGASSPAPGTTLVMTTTRIQVSTVAVIGSADSVDEAEEEMNENGRPRIRGRCTARRTGDLLDCDCGYITTHQKIRILAERDEHDTHHAGKRIE